MTVHTFAQVDPATGEILREWHCPDFDLSEARQRADFSKWWRGEGEPALPDGLLERLGAPDWFEPVGTRRPLNGLAAACYAMARESAPYALETNRKERASGAVPFGQQTDLNGDRVRTKPGKRRA